MATFGGFSNNALITNFIEYIVGEQEFISMVISHSNLLAPFNRKNSEVIAVAKRQSYPRIGLILAAAKNTDNTYLFADPLNPTNLNSLYNNVLFIMTDSTCPFAEGITRVATALTASLLIRQLPLNGDIRNIDLGDKIEEQAINDLDRIIGLVSKSNLVSSFTTTQIIPTGDSIYISLGIDKTTLPESYFNVEPRDDVASFEELHPTEQVKVLETLSVPADSVAYCYFYHSAWEQEAQDSHNNIFIEVNQPIEGYFEIKSGYTAEKVISLLADLFNESALKFTTAKSNIIASPVRGNSSLSTLTLIKENVYPEINDVYKRKTLTFKLLYNINYLAFHARRLSSIINRELVIIRFHTVTKTTLASISFPLLTSTYKGLYNPLESYIEGDIVDFNGISYILTTGTSIGITPPSNLTIWSLLYSNLASPKIRNVSENKIEGLLYGLIPAYNYLDELGPKSLIIDVEKGTLRTVSASNETSDEDKAFLCNTFYFKLSEGFTTVQGTLRIRFSSTNIQERPELLSVLDNELAYSFIVNGTEEDVAIATLQAIFRLSQFTEVLGVLVHPNAVQIVNFKKTNQETKEIVDLLDVELIAGLEIATGTPIEEQTGYSSFSRSVVVKADSLKESTSTLSDNQDYEVGIANISKTKRSEGLQYVYDKIKFLDRKNKGGRNVLFY